MLNSNSIGFSISDNIVASKKAACNLYLLRFMRLNFRTSAWATSVTGSSGCASSSVWISNKILPR